MGLFGGKTDKLFSRSGERRDVLFSGVKAAQFIPEGGRPSFWHGPPRSRWSGESVDRYWKAIRFIEGGTDPSGAFRTSPRGAVGPGQIMPRTAPEAAGLAGLPWDERRYRTDRDYNIALGRAYYRQQLDEFGDPVLAAAAYNWGPTALRSAICDSRRTGRPLKAYLPAETLKYVTRFARSVGSQMTTEPRTSRGCSRN